MRIVNKKQKKRHSVGGGRDGPRWRRCWTAERSGAVASSRSRGLRCAPGRGERDEKRAAITVAAVDVYWKTSQIKTETPPPPDDSE